MNRPARIHRPVFASLTLTCLAAAWWGCAQAAGGGTTGLTTASSASSTSSSTSGGGGAGGAGGADFDGGHSDAAACVSTSAAAHHQPVDIVFCIDQGDTMHGPQWLGMAAALTAFFNDPASDGIGAGIEYFPHVPEDDNWGCNATHYESLAVPIDVLPVNAFALTNSLPANAEGDGEPRYAALQGTLSVATAYQDAHPTHKVILVLSTDGKLGDAADPQTCNNAAGGLAALAASALAYNGVLTYVIGVDGALLSDLDQIAAGGGTTAAYDVTTDITQFAGAIAKIREAELGCDYQIPAPPNNEQLDPDQVNVSYTPQGMGMATVLLRSQDQAACNGQPGWYYDNNTAPTKITLCPASCATVQADDLAQVSVLFGCKSLLN